MFSRLLGILSLLVMVNVSAMEPICYLAYMLPEVRNIIGYFLMCDDESQEEFIERTRKITSVPNEYFCNYYQKLNSASQAQMVAGFCPQKTTIALIEMISTRPHLMPKRVDLQIIDNKKEEKKDAVLYKEKLALGKYQCVALSPHASMIATVIAREEYIPVCRGVYNVHFLTIKNFTTQKIREFGGLPFKFSSIAFNKQGDHLIAHDITWKAVVGGESEYRIFPLKIIESNGIDRIYEKKNQFQDYCRERRICKNIGNSNT